MKVVLQLVPEPDESLCIGAVHAHRGFDFEANNLATPFHDYVDLMPISVAKMEQLRRRLDGVERVISWVTAKVSKS